jgi:hypothetical protein
MSRLTNEQLTEIRKRAEAATAGPWTIEKESYVCNAGFWVTDTVIMPDITSNIFEETDAEFIAHAREDVPDLLAEIERLRADQGRIIAELKKADIFSEELERKYFAAKWPEIEASIKQYAEKIRRERNDSDI